MLGKLSKKMTTLIVIVSVIILCITATILFSTIPRHLTDIAGIGKIENATAITYKTSPCCGMEGSEFETTITDKAAIERMTKQFNSAKMKWHFPVSRAGGINCDITFSTPAGKKLVKFNQGQIGNYQFVELQNALSSLLSEAPRPPIYLHHNHYNVDINANSYIINSNADYQDFITTINNNQNPQDNVTPDFFMEKKIVVINLGIGSSSRQFYLIKITQTEVDSYHLKITDMQRNDNYTDDLVPMAAMLYVPRDLDTKKLTFDIT